jgi:hypothetical protein
MLQLRPTGAARALSHSAARAILVTLTVAGAFLCCAYLQGHELKAPGGCPGALSYNSLLRAGQKRGQAGAPHQLKR